MKKFLLSIILVISLLTQTCIAQPNLKTTQHAAMHRVSLETELLGVSCTAYAISEHALLLAAHCDEPNSVLKVDDEEIPRRVSQKLFDNKDHMILVMPDAHFTETIVYPVNYRKPFQGEHIYMWGNPRLGNDVYEDQYREGYITGTGKSIEGDSAEGIFYLMSFPGGTGDSGAAVFGSDGRVITVITYRIADGMLMGGYPLAFTARQIAEATK